ncbi:radical SAM protein [Streptomyces albidoflavus]
MTTIVEPPTIPFAGIKSLELEITGTCQLSCTHCLSESSPQATHGEMTAADWERVIQDAASLGVRTIQLIGGEPTVHPQWQHFTELALSLDMGVEVYSNLFHVAPTWWDLLARDGVTLGTSYYSDDPTEHDRITRREGSYLRTRENIREALSLGIAVRAGIVSVLPDQRVAQARAELEALGVTRITMDRARAVGRSRLPGTEPSLDEMCGRCTRGRAAVLPNGNLAGCVLARDFPAGNVKNHGLAELLSGRKWADLAANVPLPRLDACPPDDSSDCNPANTEACSPSSD